MNTSNSKTRLYSIGHSTHSIGHFLNLLKQHNIKAIADVRSVPYSRHNPQFSREGLVRTLKGHGIGYFFLGKELGARRNEPECYQNHKVNYDQVAQAPAFRGGLHRLVNISLKMNVAMLCAEKDPLTCHRTILIARHIKDLIGVVLHILGDGNIETNEQAEERLLKEHTLQNSDLFTPREQLIAEAYQKRAVEIAYEEPIPYG